MYTGIDPALIDLQLQITALNGRQGVIDGAGLADPTLSFVNQTSRKFEGQKQDQIQLVNRFQQMLSGYTNTVTGFITMLKTHIGIL